MILKVARDAKAGDRFTSVSISPRRDAGKPELWRVDVQFKNIFGLGGGGGGESSAEKWNINIKVKPATYEEEAEVDANETPVVNVLGDKFNPSIKRVYYDKDYVITFTTSNAQACIDAIDACEDRYNDGPITMSVNGVTRRFAKGTLLFVSPDYDTIRVGSPPYKWNFEYIFRYRRQQKDANKPGQLIGGWITQVANRGMRYINPALPGPNKVVNGIDAVGIHHGEPVLLEANGEQVKPGLFGPGKANFLQFDFHTGADFTQLWHTDTKQIPADMVLSGIEPRTGERPWKS